MDDSAVVRLAQELVRIPSTTHHEREIALHLASVMEPIFDKVEVDDFSNAIGIMDGTASGPTVLFNGHIDHVDPAEMEAPYSGQLVDAEPFGGSGKAIFGRGASDMKGGVASMVGAAARLRSKGFRGRLILTAVALEETGEGTGTLNAMMSLDERPDVAIVGEATAGDLCLGHRGKVELELEVKGRTAHASNPSQGINAILLMNEFISAWPQLPMPEHPIVGRCSSCITNITCSPGRLAVIPDRCTLTFDNRFLPGESPERPVQDVLKLLEQISTSSRGSVYELRCRRVLPSYLVPPDDPYVSLMSSVVADISGRLPAKRGWLFGTDGAYLVNELKIPTVGFGPGDERFAHTPVDHVPVADLLLACRAYVEFVRRLGELSAV